MSDPCPKCPNFDGYPKLMHKGAYRECYKCGRQFTKDDKGKLIEIIAEPEPEELPKSELEKLMGSDAYNARRDKGRQVIGPGGPPKGTPNKPRVVK